MFLLFVICSWCLVRSESTLACSEITPSTSLAFSNILRSSPPSFSTTPSVVVVGFDLFIPNGSSPIGVTNCVSFDFELFEDSLPVGSLADQTKRVVTRYQLHPFLTLLLDVTHSPSSPSQRENLASAVLYFLREVTKIPNHELLRVSIGVFDASRSVEYILPFTFLTSLNAHSLEYAILNFKGDQREITNVNGAVLSGVSHLNRAVSSECAIKSTGILVVFTSHLDTAGYHSDEEAYRSISESDNASFSSFALGVGASTFHFGDWLSRIGINGYVEGNWDSLERNFLLLRDLLLSNQAHRYLLGYCSSKTSTSGMSGSIHEVSVALLVDSGNSRLTVPFDTSKFDPSSTCSVRDVMNIVVDCSKPNPQDPGLWWVGGVVVGSLSLFCLVCLCVGFGWCCWYCCRSDDFGVKRFQSLSTAAGYSRLTKK